MTRARPRARRSEEEKRNLKVDLRRIPEWEAELKSIRARFRRFDLSQVSTAATLIHETRAKLNVDGHTAQRTDQQALAQWKNKLNVDNLIRVSQDYSAPEFLRCWKNDDLTEYIRDALERTEHCLAEYQKRGSTDSFWVSMFSSKVDTSTVRGTEKRKEEYLELVRTIPRIEEAMRLLSEVHSDSQLYSTRVKKIEAHLALAEEKKGAIERFEAKHGKAFAKAAAADNHTRVRATSLKRLVKRPQVCPYCGTELGSNPHLDHIYPVSKGGLSIVENLIWCCSVCNSLKTDKGLMQFLVERGLPIEQTLARLHSLGKHV